MWTTGRRSPACRPPGVNYGFRAENTVFGLVCPLGFQLSWDNPPSVPPAMFLRVKASLPPIENPLNVNHVQPAIRSCRTIATDHITKSVGADHTSHRCRAPRGDRSRPDRDIRIDCSFIIVAGGLILPCPGEARTPVAQAAILDHSRRPAT